MKPSLRIVVFVVVAAVHFVVSMVLFFRSFASTMDSMDTGIPPTASEKIVSSASDIMFFPLVTLSGLLPDFLGPLANIPFILNSMLWSTVICVFGGFILSRRRRGGLTEPEGRV